MKNTSFERFSFVDDISMEIVVTYEDNDYIRHYIKQMINWVMKNCNKIKDIISFSKTFGSRNRVDIFFSKSESSYFMLIDYELFRKYVSDLNEMIIRNNF